MSPGKEVLRVLGDVVEIFLPVEATWGASESHWGDLWAVGRVGSLMGPAGTIFWGLHRGPNDSSDHIDQIQIRSTTSMAKHN